MPVVLLSFPAPRPGPFRLLRSPIVLLVWLTLAASLCAAPEGLEARPLAVSAPSDRAMGFTRLDPAATGLSAPNLYADPSMWGQRNHAFKFGAIGTGIAIGDYDNDGRPDVLVVRKTEPLRLFRNLGDWRFADVTAEAGLVAADSLWQEGISWVRGLMDENAELAADQPERWKQGAAFADVNNDGWLDLYVCRFDAPNWLFINQGDGTFTEEAAARGLAITDASGMAAFCDYDRDGDLDVYLQTNLFDVGTAPTGQPDRLLRNDGTGHFTDVSAAAGIGGPSQGHAAIWWDYDADGWPDLYVANDFAPPDRLYRNGGDGTFRDVLNEVVPHTPHSAMGADLGDADNDGRLDLLVADMAATTHEKDQRGMARIRALLDEHPEPPGTAPQIMRNALYLNTGTGRMREAAFLAGLAATDWTWSVRWEDLDNDGRVDLHVTNGMVRELHNADLVRRYSAAESPLAAARLEKASPVLAEANLAYRNRGDLQFEEVGQAWGLDHVGVSFGAAFGDLDGDGDLDLVVSNYEDDVTVLRNDSPDGHRVVIALRGTQSNRFGVGATVRIETEAGEQVRTLVLARGYLSSSEPVLHFGLGQSDRIRRLTVEWPSGGRQTFTDLPVDQRLVVTEVAVTEGADAQPSTPAPLFTLVGTTPAATPSPREETPPLPRLAPFQRAPFRHTVEADLDGDGRIDRVVANEWEPVRWWRDLGEGHYEDRTEAAGLAAAGTGWWSALAVADLNDDGRPEIIVGNAGLNTPYHASPAEPIVQFIGDFAGTGEPIVVETEWEGGELYPRRPLNVWSAEVRNLRRKIRRNDDWAQATVESLFDPEQLAAAQRLAATELRSGIFWAEQGGRYRFEPLPRVAQIAPVTAILAGDWDGDGHIDLVLGQNDFSPIGSIGRFDGGLGQLLRGDGRGHFTPMSPAESGIVVPGAVTGIQAEAVGAGPDASVRLTFTRLGEPALIFERQPPR